MNTSQCAICDRLRAETASWHRRLETVVGVPDSLSAHRVTLVRFYGFIAAWEPQAFDALGSLAPAMEERRKAHLLAADLHAVGIDPKHVPLCSQLPPLTTLAQALGSFYVLEGATLGGQIISRALESNLGMSEGVGYSYFQSYPGRVGAMWGKFKALLQEHSEPRNETQMVDAACRTFGALFDWFKLAHGR